MFYDTLSSLLTKSVPSFMILTNQTAHSTNITNNTSNTNITNITNITNTPSYSHFNNNHM